MDVQKKLQAIYAGEQKDKRETLLEIVKKDPNEEGKGATKVEEGKNTPLDEYLEKL